jgi:hypothetical protein
MSKIAGVGASSGNIREVVCTKERPWQHNPYEKVRVIHPDAREVGEQEDGWPGGDIVRYECPNCGHRWKQELPQ